MFIDARIPVVFGATPREDDAVLVPEQSPLAHPAGCTCCVPRGAAATAFDRLFLDRVRGTVPWFTRVVVPDDDPALRNLVQDDPVVSSRFRLG